MRQGNRGRKKSCEMCRKWRDERLLSHFKTTSTRNEKKKKVFFCMYRAYPTNIKRRSWKSHNSIEEKKKKVVKCAENEEMKDCYRILKQKKKKKKKKKVFLHVQSLPNPHSEEIVNISWLHRCTLPPQFIRYMTPTASTEMM